MKGFLNWILSRKRFLVNGYAEKGQSFSIYRF